MALVSHGHTWQPLSSFGFTHPFFTVQADLVIATWIALALLTMLALLARWSLGKPDSLIRIAALSTVRQFSQLLEQTTSHPAAAHHVYFIITLFTFILICNWLILIGIEEPTSNYNTTAALALTAFIYIQVHSIRARGVIAYTREYLKLPFKLGKLTPFNAPLILIKIAFNTALSLALLPLELMSKFASVVSLSFRLFGNILAGSLITSMAHSWASGNWLVQALLCFTGINILIVGFFVIFEGLIQAFVFTILTTTYLAVGTQQEAHDE